MDSQDRRKKNSDSKNWVTESVRAFELKIFVVRTGQKIRSWIRMGTIYARVSSNYKSALFAAKFVLLELTVFTIFVSFSPLLPPKIDQCWIAIEILDGKFIKLYHEIVKSDSYYSKKLNLSSISNKIRNSDFRKPLRKRNFGTFLEIFPNVKR